MNFRILQETFVVQDCTKYDPTEYTSTQNVQIALPSNDFEISAQLYHTSFDWSYPQLYIGTELSTNYISIGKIKSSYYGSEFKKNGTQLTLLKTSSQFSDNAWHNVTLRRVGNNYSIICDNETLTYTNSTIILTYLFLIYLPENGDKCKNLKIKPL